MTKLTEVVDMSIDLGNFMNKGAVMRGGKPFTRCIPNRTQTTNPPPKSKSKLVEIKGEDRVYIGIGKLNNSKLKHTRPHLLQTVMAMANELCPSTNRLAINLKIGLPYNLYDVDKYVDELKDNFATGVWIEHSVNGVEREIIINKIQVYLEGYAGFSAIADKVQGAKRVLQIDVGGGTIDSCEFTWDKEYEEYDASNPHTISQGVISLTDKIAEAINREENADITGLMIDEALRDKEEYIEYGVKKFKITDYIYAINADIKNIISELIDTHGKLEGYYIVGIGGGYEVFSKLAKESIQATIVVEEEERFYANAIGYLLQD